MENSLKWNELSCNYDEKVYSITKWKPKRDRILAEIINPKKILIAGCGSETYLQRDIIDIFPDCIIYLMDISAGMISQSKKNFNHENLVFINQDMSKKIDVNFDYIISTNSILAETKEFNNTIIEILVSSLFDNGKLIAYLPSWESCINLVTAGVGLDLNDVEQSLDDGCGMVQSFFSLNQISEYEKIGSLTIKSVNCSETIEERISLESIYGLTENQSKMVFEYFVTLSSK